MLQKQSMSKNFIDSINKWTEAFEEADPLLKFEQAKDEEVIKRNMLACI